MSTSTTIINTDIQFRLSGGVNNGNPALSIGGPMSQVKPGDLDASSGVSGELWDFVPLSEATTGLPAEFRCVYIYNGNQTGVKLVNAFLWFDSLNTDSNISNSVGLDPSGLNGTAQTIPDEQTAPIGVVFTQPKTKHSGLSLGTMSAGAFYPIWLKRQIAAGSTPFFQDSFIIRVEGEPPAAGLPPPPGPPGSPPPPPPPPPGTGGGGPDFGFAAAGKWSCNSAAQANVNNIIARLTSTPPLGVFVPGGDISYTADPTCWFNMTSRIDHITHITLGTMEQDTELGAQPAILNNWLSHYALQSTFYSFDFNDVHFLMLNTEIPFDTSSAQYRFAVSDLTAASTKSSIDWVVVRSHQPMYSAGGNGDVNGFNHLNWASTYGPLFDAYQVDLVIQVHPRNYQRTLPVRFNSATPSTPTVMSGISGNNYTNPNGVIYIVAGTGGHVLDTGTITSLPYMAFTQNTSNGYLYITITQNGSLMTGSFYNTSNNAIDKFTITKT